MAINREILTLEEFRKAELRCLPHATGELSSLLRDIALAAKRINAETSRAGLADIFGDAGIVNVHEEAAQKLDVFANSQLLAVLRRGTSCAGAASEEMEDFVAFDDPLSNQSKYVCAFDPLDGSSNIDTNLPIGTIFGVWRRLSERGGPCRQEDFLQPGSQQIAAGYIIYGPSTMLVYATRRGVNGFTLDPLMGEFTLSHPNIHVPENGAFYSINQGKSPGFSDPVQSYLLACQQNGNDLRYTGSMVADLHRTLIKGGIFLYPYTTKHPKGKLRLIYECSPFAFIVEMAGGSAINFNQRILDISPSSLHQCTPFFAGSRKMINHLKNFIEQSYEI